MRSEEKLYEAFGELIYVVAMADGAIQSAELKVIEQRLAGHPWGSDIKWSFDYEVKKENSLEDLYKKVIIYCESHGPDEEYQFLIETLEAVAGAHAGIEKEEKEVMDSFVFGLTEKFKKDIERINGYQ